ncbi:MAG: MFS transporter [Acidobacteriota bacterium]|nr:MAG: MFS transporter [Acidobacteriota bacterium]
MLGRVVASYREAFRGLPGPVWLLCVAALVHRAGTLVLPFLSLYLTEELGLTLRQAGLLLGLYGVAAIPASLLGGWLSDRIGALRVLALSLVGSGVVLLLLVWARSLLEIGAGIVLLSLIAEPFRPAVMSALSERAPIELRPRAFALLRLAVNLGMTVGPAFGGFIATRNYGWLFVIDAVTCWLALLVVRGALSEPQPSDASASDATTGRGPWRDGPFLLLMLIILGLAAVVFQFLGSLPVFFRRDYGLTEDLIGLLLGLNALIIVLVEMPLVRELERFDRLRIVGLGCVLTCVGFGILPLGESIGFAALSIAIWTAGEMLTLPFANALVAERAPRAHRGRYMGVYTMTYALAFVVAPLGGMALYQRFGGGALWGSILAMALPLGLGCLALVPVFGVRRAGSD